MIQENTNWVMPLRDPLVLVLSFNLSLAGYILPTLNPLQIIGRERSHRRFRSRPYKGLCRMDT